MLDRTKAFRINQARSQGWGERAEAFVTWQDDMDKHVQARCGIGIHDLPDWDFASAFERGESAKDAAERFIEDLSEALGIDEYDF
jgi:hypothetical protein